jgi:hypothetical protein
MNIDDKNSRNARDHTEALSKEFEAIIEHLRADVEKVDDPRAQALFETSAEVIGGLQKAFAHYGAGTEPAWRR